MEMNVEKGGESPTAQEVKEGSIKMNLPYTLKVWDGTDYSGDNSVAGDERTVMMIGSEIPPKGLGKIEGEYTGNGSFEDSEYYLIVQDGEPLLVEQEIVHETYGYNIQREDWVVRVYKLPTTKEFKLNEFL